MKVLCYVFGVVDGLQDLWYVFLRLFRLYALGGGGAVVVEGPQVALQVLQTKVG